MGQQLSVPSSKDHHVVGGRFVKLGALKPSLLVLDWHAGLLFQFFLAALNDFFFVCVDENCIANKLEMKYYNVSSQSDECRLEKRLRDDSDVSTDLPQSSKGKPECIYFVCYIIMYCTYLNSLNLNLFWCPV